MSNYTIRKTESRERRYAELQDSTGCGHTSQAIDEAVQFYLQMTGHNGVNPNAGAFEELMQLAIVEGSVTPDQIAETLDTPEVPVEYSSSWFIGEE